MGNYVNTSRKCVAFRFQPGSWSVDTNWIGVEDCEEVAGSSTGSTVLQIASGADGYIQVPRGWWAIQHREGRMQKRNSMLSNSDFAAQYGTDLLPGW